MATTSYNALKSTAGVISEFTKAMKDYVLKPDESLVTVPAGFINLHMSTLGKLSAYSFYEHMMNKKEINISTAIQTKSLLRHLNSEEIASVYGAPSAMTFIIAYNEEEIIKSAVLTSNGDYRLRLNKDFTMMVSDKPTFTLDHDIEIIVSKYVVNGVTKNSIYAKFDTSDKIDGLSNIENPFITSRSGVIIDGEKYFAMFVPMRQYERSYTIVELNGSNNDQEINYTNELMGFSILYKAPSATSYSVITAYPEGEDNANGPNYHIGNSGSNKVLYIDFSKIPNNFSPTNGTLKVTIYTTEGTNGNFTLPDIEENASDLDATFAQDKSDPAQEYLMTIIPIVSIKTATASGGRNAMTIEEIRAFAINKTNNNNIIAPGQIEKKANEYGYNAYKTRHDVETFEYRVSGFIKDADEVILPTGMISINFNYADIPPNDSIDARMITPRHIFRNESGTEYSYVKQADLNSYTDYINKFKNNTINDMVSPFFLKIGVGSDLSVGVYDMSIDDDIMTEFEFINDAILDKMSILDVVVSRNPLDNSTRTNNDGAATPNGDFYCVEFVVSTSTTICDHIKNLQSYEKPYVKFKLVIKNTTDSGKFTTDCDLDNIVVNANSTLTCKIYLETDNAISNGDKINIIDNSIKKIPYTGIPYQFYFVDAEVNIQLAVLFLSTTTSRPVTSYDDILTDNDKIDKYYVGIVYNVNNVQLVKNLSDYVSLYPSVKLTQPSYKYAESDIADTYDATVYDTNDDGSYKTVPTHITNPDGTVSTIEKIIVVHNKGDIKKEYDGRTGSYDLINGIWSSKSLAKGFMSDGTHIGKNNIYCTIEYKDLILFAGYNGRVFSYDTLTNKFYSYDDTALTRVNGQMIIKSNGTPMGGSTIRGMLIIGDQLIVYGDAGRVASCDLTSNKWRNYDSLDGNSIAYLYNNGVAMGESNIYTAIVVDKYIVFAGSLGRVACFNTEVGSWIPYNTTSTIESITNNGIAMDGETIYTMQVYAQSIIIVAGGSGRVASCTIASRKWNNYNSSSGIRNSGLAMNENSIYTSTILNGIYIVGGKDGYVASYDILKNIWTTSSQDGFSSTGSSMGNLDIYTMIPYDTIVIFGGKEGRISSYNTSTAVWTPYSALSGIRNDGSFINNSISTFIIYNSILYAGGRDGNIIYKYRKGDPLYDANGSPLVSVNSQYIGCIKGVPAYNRIYGVKNKYLGIIKSYNELLANIITLKSYFVDGCTLSLGVKRTSSGKSSVYKYTSLTDNVNYFIDDNSLSFNIGIKLNDNVLDTDKSYIVSLVKSSIITYVKNFTGIRFSIYKMLDEIKNNNASIDSFEIYEINNYKSSECQTIFKDEVVSTNVSNYTPVDEALTIKYVVDETNSNVENGEVAFIPNITIKLL